MTGNAVRKWGPGMLVTAAFIGPGTVTVASISGANEGYSLLWVVILGILAVIAFQDMSARLGIVTGRDLAQAMRGDGRRNWLAWPAILLVLLAVIVGNAAYQAGNILGATIGLAELTGQDKRIWTLLIAAVASLILWNGKLRVIQVVLGSLVALMSGLFVICMLVVQPDWSAVARGLTPQLEPGSLLLVLGLLGTTVVPYNLFLHSRTAVDQWHQTDLEEAHIRQRLRQARLDTIVAVSLGGIVTAAILITAAAVFYQRGIELTRVAEIANQLQPLLGGFSQLVFCLGLTAAGLTSAVTAPLAAGFVAAGCFAWGNNLRDWRTRVVMFTIMAIGMAVMFLFEGESPAEVILVAQVANGLILPVVALFLVLSMNSPRIPRAFRNRWLANTIGGMVIVVVTLIAATRMPGLKPLIRQFQNPPAEINRGNPPVRIESGNPGTPDHDRDQ